MVLRPNLYRSFLMMIFFSLSGLCYEAQAQLIEAVKLNTLTKGMSPVIAMNAQGDGVIVWHGWNSSGLQTGIYAVRYNNTTGVQETEFQVGAFSNYYQLNPAVAMDLLGIFVIVWQGGEQGTEYQFDDIYAQRYDASGNPLGMEFRVNTTTDASQSSPTVAMNKQGEFIIAWESNASNFDGRDIFAQRYDSNGMPEGSEFRVNTTTYSTQYSPAAALNSEGNVVIAWSSIVEGQHDSNLGDEASDVFAQRYDALGNPSGVEFRVNTTLSEYQESPAIAMNDSGNFVIAWDTFYQEVFWGGISGQRYDSAGNPLGTEFEIGSSLTHNANSPTAAMSPQGDFVVSWTVYGDYLSYSDVIAHRFDPEGNASGPDIEVSIDANPMNNLQGRDPSVAMDDQGNFIIVWEMYEDIYLRRFAQKNPPYLNHLPEFVSMAEDSSVVIPFQAGDPDGDPISLQAESPQLAWIDNSTIAPLVPDDNQGNNYQLTLKPLPQQSGTVTVTIWATDGILNVSKAIQMEVTAENDPPVANDDYVFAYEDVPTEFYVSYNDYDIENTYDIISFTQPSHGQVAEKERVYNEFGLLRLVFLYTPDQHYHGNDTFTYRASDSDGGYDEATVWITIHPVNDSPFLSGLETQVIAIHEDSSTGPIPFHAGDPDGDPISFSKTSSAPWLFSPEAILIEPRVPADKWGNYQVTVIPAPDESGTATVTITVSDGLLSASGDLSIEVEWINDDPVANDDFATTYVDSPVDVPVLNNDTDIDGPVLEIFYYTSPSHGSVHETSYQALTYTPDPGFVGTDTFTYAAHDHATGVSIATVTVTVRPTAVSLVCGPLVGLSASPQVLGQSGVSVSAQASFTDSADQEPHQAQWDWGNGVTTEGEVSFHEGQGLVTGVYAYTEAGLYPVTITITNVNNDSCSTIFRHVVVVNPARDLAGGYGTIRPEFQNLLIPVFFGFVAQYDADNQPQSWVELWTSGGRLVGTSCDWLIINGNQIKIQGSGQINGSGDYGFMLTAIAGEPIDPPTAHRLRIKLWEKSTGQVLYDTHPQVEDHLYEGLPLQMGLIVVQAQPWRSK